MWAAVSAWCEIEQQSAEYLSLAGRRILNAYEHLGRAAEGVALLRGWLSTFPDLDLVDLLYPRIVALNG